MCWNERDSINEWRRLCRVFLLTHVTANYFGRVAIAVLSENGDRPTSKFTFLYIVFGSFFGLC